MDSTTSPFVYSRRLTSLAAHIVFVSLALFEAATVLVSVLDQPVIHFVYLPLLPLYFIGGTVGWQWTQRYGRYQGVYFISMTLLGLTNALIASLALDGMIGMLSTLMLIMQGAVLGRWQRSLFIISIVSTIAIIGFVTGNAFGLTSWLTLLSAMSAVLAFSFFGDVIVSEEKARTQLARYAGQIEELSIMRERNRLAREIHDNLGHYMTAINMQAQAAQAVLKLNPQQADEALTHIRSLAREGLQEVRQSIAAVRALPLENRTLSQALDALVNDSRARGLAVEFQVVGTPIPVATEIEMTLYRIVQESLTNTHKHAQAQHATIALHYEQSPQSIALHIHDDGVGAVTMDGGFGLFGLRERVRLLGGTLQLRTAPGDGFAMDVRVRL